MTQLRQYLAQARRVLADGGQSAQGALQPVAAWSNPKITGPRAVKGNPIAEAARHYTYAQVADGGPLTARRVSLVEVVRSCQFA
jgi:hypothetical protein